jgi:transmembrane 9 superfamily member 2/4
VTKLTSTKTQMPYDYYSLPYCKPSKLGLQKENLGQVVSGERVENSVYKVGAIFSLNFPVLCIELLNKRLCLICSKLDKLEEMIMMT